MLILFAKPDNHFLNEKAALQTFNKVSLELLLQYHYNLK